MGPHEVERGIEQATDLFGVLALPLGHRAAGDAAADVPTGGGGRRPGRRRLGRRRRDRCCLGRYCVLDSQNHILVLTEGGHAWRGTSKPILNTKRSWTGWTPSSARRWSRSTWRSPTSSSRRSRASAARRSTRSRRRCRRHGLWATHLGPELGGQGYGQLKLALLNEILGRSSWAPIVFGCQAPDTGNAEIIAHYGTDAQKERYLQPLLHGRVLLQLLDDRAPRRGRPDPVQDAGRQGR